MIRSLMTFLLAVSTLFCNAQKNTTDTTLRYLLLGDLKGDLCRAEIVVAQKYGFGYLVVAGCVVTHEFDDSVTRENKKLDKILEHRFGRNWKIKFNKEVDTLMKLQAKVEMLVEKEPCVIAKKKDVDLRYLIVPDEYPNIFSVKAWSWRRESETKVSKATYLKLTVNLATKTVTKDSDVIESYKDPLD